MNEKMQLVQNLIIHSFQLSFIWINLFHSFSSFLCEKWNQEIEDKNKKSWDRGKTE